MPKRDNDLLLSDMIECGKKVLNHVKGMDFDAFINDAKTVDAVIRNFEILGEASIFL